MKIVTPVVLGLATLLVACGGDDEPRLTRAQFVERGNAICAESLTPIEEGGVKTFTEQGKVPTSEQIDRFVSDAVVPAVDRQLDELKELKAPEDDEARIERMLEEGREALDDVKSFSARLRLDPFLRYAQMADEYGLRTCGDTHRKIDTVISGVSGGTPPPAGG